MGYLNKVIKEVQRLCPLVAVIGRTIPQDFRFGKYTFVKGSDMIIYIQGIHMDPKHYPEPEKFDPERFEGDSSRHSFSFIPFSAGQRSCIGQRFAMLEIKALVAKILMNYKVVPAVPKRELFIINDGVIKSKNGIHIGMEKRVY